MALDVCEEQIMQASGKGPGEGRRRRKWSAAEKAQLIEEAMHPDATVISVADKYGISRGLFYRWMARAQAGLPVEQSSDDATALRLVAAQREAPVAGPMPAPVSFSQKAARMIEVTLGNGRILRATENIDPVLLARLVEALDKPI
jgi:transposase